MTRSNVIEFPVLKRLVGPKTAEFIRGIAASDGHEPSTIELMHCARQFISLNTELQDLGLPSMFNPQD